MILPLLAVCAACWPSLIALHGYWTDFKDITYTHGYLVLLIAVYLLWRRLPGWPAATRPSIPASIGLAIAGLIWALAVQSGIEFVELALLPVLLWLAVFSGCGWGAARVVAFPLGFLYFAMPLWSAINGALQAATIGAVRVLVRMFGVSAYFEGNRVLIPEGQFEIAGGCSGLHFFIVGMIIGALMGELRTDSPKMRLNVLAMAGGLAIAGNWLRVLTIILAGHYTDMQHYIVSQSHYYFGWGVFGVMMVIFFLWERRLPGAPPASGQTIPPGAILTRPGALAHVVAAAGLFGLLRLAASTPSEQSWLPESVAGWRRAGADAGFAPRLAGIDASRVFRYTASAAAVDYYEGLYTSQKQGKEFSAFGSDLSPGQQVAESAQRKVGALPVTMLHMRNSSGADNVMAVSYRVGDRDFGAALPAQLYYGLRSLLSLGSPLSTIRIWRVSCERPCVAAEGALLQFVGATGSQAGVPTAGGLPPGAP